MGVSTWTITQDQVILDGLKANLTYTQIATSLGVSKAMVSGRLYRLRKLRPGDVPQKKVQVCQRRQTAWRTGIKFGKPKPNSFSHKSALIEKLIWRDQKIISDKTLLGSKPNSAAVPFMALERGACTWCVSDEVSSGIEVGAGMMCCAAPVVNARAHEGDRRATHCQYHYELSRHEIPKTPGR